MRVHHNCCGLDVHKKMIAACLLREDAAGNAVTEKRLFGTMTRKLHALAQWICAAQVTAVAMEATGVYWIPVRNVVEQYGLQLLLITVNSTTGALTAVGSPVPAGNGPNCLAEDPSGTFLYATNNFSNDVSTFSIDSSTGALTPVGLSVPADSGPESVTVDLSGKFVYVANEAGQDISVFVINPSTGALTAVGFPVPGGDVPVSVVTTGGT